ncbi:MAG: hypothetical protein R3C03_00060 [Pirellulaceae bacterium]
MTIELAELVELLDYRERIVMALVRQVAASLLNAIWDTVLDDCRSVREQAMLI